MAVVATWITSQLVFNGLVTGMVIGLLAMGVVLVYRSNRVINFAVANMGLVGAALLLLMVADHDIPFWVSLVACLAIGTLYGAGVELVVIRRLFSAPRVIVLVATIGVAQLSLGIVAALPKLQAVGASYPVAVSGDWQVAGIDVTGAQLSIVVVVPVVALALAWFLNRTLTGKAVKAAAENADLARLSRINPKLVSLLVWSIGGFLATLSMILVLGQASAGGTGTLTAIGPSTLVRALAAAVIAGMFSFPRALVAGMAIGVCEAVLRFNFLEQVGLIDFVLFVVVLVAVWFQSRQPGETQSFSFAPKIRPIPDRLRRVWWVRHMTTMTMIVLGLAAVLLPVVITQPSRHLLYASIAAFAICGVSLTVLTGWAGQLSLSQMTFAGFGALLAAALQRGFRFGVGWQGDQLFDIHLHSMPTFVAIGLATVLVAALAAVIGLGALRVRGLLLAVSTFAFAVAASQYVFRRPFLQNGNVVSVPLPRGTLLGLDLSSQRTFYYVVLVGLVLVLLLVARLRRSGVGRSTVAVRDNAERAAAYTVEPTRVKLRAFALAGGIAAFGGALLGALVTNVPLQDRFFTVESSLQLVSIAVIGGLGSLLGPVLGSLWVIGLPSFFPESTVVPLFTSSVGLLVLLLYFPGGLVQIAHSARNMLLTWAEGRLPPEPTKTVHETPPAVARRARPELVLDGAALRTRDVRVRFGGLVAVDGASIEVGDGEIVGLIGTNGAGKSTFMNAIGGFVDSVGTVELLGRDVTHMRAPRRAQLGLGRTFQAATLFPELSVRETVEVALEARARTGLLSVALLYPRSTRMERAKRAEAAELIDFLGLGRYGDAFVGDLSTGTRRIVELAGLLALDARVLCLDEPTAGIAQRETEAFGPLIMEIQRELGASMLVIEHDMPLIMSISDRIYCLEAGHVIADGPPDVVRDDPAVVASYLGSDERAIARSGVVPSRPTVPS
jgi:ABC-type branched-subunit amino acid transport system ATPase component/branched-subunit amino acid ABC-type transport system permease component